jgi:tRNA 2-thiouridine synthesizing protein B
MTLHILNKTSSNHAVNDQLTNTIEEGDQVILIEDGVLQCLSQSPSDWKARAQNIYVLGEDAQARGIEIPESYHKTDYNGFVELTVEHTKVISWY